METYNHKEIEQKWREKWDAANIYKTTEDSDKEKFYILDMFPYPSGEGLHVGHPKGYVATDIISRYKKMTGFNVLHPMGWDAFGLPAEQHALKNKVHPRVGTDKNIATFKKQLEKISINYDWERELSTTDPEFYKWTQWAFIQMYKKGLVYQSNEPINWCPSCKTGLANEDLENGCCERCDTPIEKKKIPQWVIKITDYADRMLADIDKLDWQESIKESQRNWIGRSEGANIEFDVKGNNEKIKVFTTRPDTLFGATYMVLAPEHALIEKLESQIGNIGDVVEYQKEAGKKTEIERTAEGKEKTGVSLDGVMAINPVNNEEIPVYIADYVLTDYGTGAIMAVPAHDERDWEFAKKYNLPIVEVISGGNVDETAYTGDGKLVNSGEFDGVNMEEAKGKITEFAGGEMTTSYKLRDWVFSRQRYWGEPMPLIHCEKCGVVTVPEDELPLVLPEVESYEPTGTGESPLADVEEWVNTKCPECSAPAKRETNTMPQWAGSSWYYLRFIDPKNDNVLVDKEKEKYWSPVDFYVGGAEHATRHLIYARFWHKFLYDIGVVSYDEPFEKLQTVGLIMAEDGRKMSKRWGNVINPDDVIDRFGSDTFRLYEMFMGPFDASVAWSTDGLVGPRKFLEKIWKAYQNGCTEGETSESLKKTLHKTIKKVGDDIGEMKYNTAISAMMMLSNELEKEKSMASVDLGDFLKILSPFAPHMTQEIWEQMGNKTFLIEETWPKYDEDLLVDDEIELVVQVNGKVRDKITVAAGLSEDEAKEKALASEKVQKHIDGKEVRKVIFVQGKLISIVV
ncbi:MAG: leucine--tRNA ligase [Patescibacteria group bacterium]